MEKSHTEALRQNLIQDIEDIVKLFVKNQDNDALKRFDSVVNSLGLLANNLSDLEVSGLQSLTANMFSCLKVKDYVRLSDSLLYELKPWLQEWNGDLTL